MIDAKQIRAARGLLDWTQETLSDRSGVARATIKNVESGNTIPRIETSNALQRALEESGVEFLPSSGVRMKDRIISVYEGADANRYIVTDIYSTLHETGGEVYIAHANEEEAIKDMGIDFIHDFLKKRDAAHIKQYLLVRGNDTGLFPPLDKYRILPDEYFSYCPFIIYGSKIAFVIQKPPQKTLIINDERLADGARKLFKFVWDRAEMPSYKTINQIR